MRGGFSEMARKTLHVAAGGFALLLGFLSWWQALALAVVALVHNLWVLPLYARRRIFRPETDESGRDWGVLLYPASIAILIVLFHTRLEIVAAAWGLLAFGDGSATIAGKTIGGPRLPWNRAKTWSGFAAFVVLGFLGARFLYVWTALGRLWTGQDGSGAVVPVEAVERALLKAPAHLGLGAVQLVETLDRGHAGFPDLLRSLASASWFQGWTVALVAILGITTLVAALLETLPLGVDDNLLVPLVSGGLLLALTLFDPSVWEVQRGWILSHLPWALAVNGALAAAAYAARAVSVSGVVGGIAMGGSIFLFGGWRAFTILVLFFLMGTAATKLGHARKTSLGIAQERGGRRGAKNAVANCAAAAVLAFVAATSPFGALALLGLVAALATAACDTVSSEIGQAYGRKPYLVTTFRPVPPGTEGAVSLEGTAAGLAGAAVIGAGASLLGLVTVPGAALAVIAALFGSTLESYVGAVWERSRRVDNEVLNFANTVAGALFAIAIPALLPEVSFFPGTMGR